ncbi:MAG: CheR family methyltransferase [Candidatus Omnitrophota bacterium]
METQKNEKIVFPEDLKEQFKDLVNSRCGLYFKDYDLKDLEFALTNRIKELGLDSAHAYYNILTLSEKKEDEFRELLNLLTVKHTYFFRNEPQFKVLKEKILPDLMSRKKTIRIWSAGCATGEEPYSIAMIIKDMLSAYEGCSVEIVATDVSTKAIENAQRGIYGANSMRLVDDEHRKKYFTEEHNPSLGLRYAIKDAIKNMVNFAYFNLMENTYPGDFDIIFCRNVVIYFELSTTISVMNKFADSLKEDGYLFIGYSESLQFISDKFKMESREDAIFYTKAGDVRISSCVAGYKGPKPRKMESIIEEISEAEVEAGSQEKWAKVITSAKLKDILVQAIEAMFLKKYQEVLSLAEAGRLIDGDAVEFYYLAAEVNLNQGHFADAKKNLDIILEKNALFAPAYYLFGSLFIEEGRAEDAEKSFRKALYLDGKFLLAHFGIANIYRDLGRIHDAIRAYRNTLNILSKCKSYDIIAYSGGFNATTLASVCRNNLERLKTA